MVHFNTSHLFVGFFQQTEPLFDLLNGLPFFQVCLYGSPSPSGQLILNLSSNKLPPTLLDDYFCSGACSLRSSLHPPPPPQSRALKTKWAAAAKSCKTNISKRHLYDYAFASALVPALLPAGYPLSITRSCVSWSWLFSVCTLWVWVKRQLEVRFWGQRLPPTLSQRSLELEPVMASTGL